MIDALVNVFEPTAVFLADVTVKATLFMGLVLFVVWLFGAQQAAKRSLLLSLCIVGLLVIPIASLFMPSLRFSFSSVENNSASVKPIVLSELPAVKPVSEPQAKRAISQPLPQMHELKEDYVSVSPAQVVFAENVSADPIDWRAWGICAVVAFYGIGMLVLFGRLINSLRLVRNFRRSLWPCEDGVLQDRLLALMQQLGIQRSVTLAVSDQIGSPTQIGLFKPIVVLPVHLINASGLSESILVHELVHVKRWDCLYRLLAMVAGTVYWFNPVFHRVNYLLSESQELVCDDWTVDTVGSSEVYAHALLNVATQMQTRPAIAMGMDMARAAQVVGRVDRIITLCGVYRKRQPVITTSCDNQCKGYV